MLTETGAIAERSTFQGERCIYNALTAKLRTLLTSYDFSKSTDLLQPWSSHITSLLTETKPKTADVALVAHSSSFELHKFILSARTEYLKRKFFDHPEMEVWSLSDAIPIEAYHIVLRYLYLGDLPRDMVGPRSRASEEQVFEGIDKVTKQLKIEGLWESVLSINDRRLTRQRYQDEVARAQGQVHALFQDTVLHHKMVVETRKVNDVKWRLGNAIFADCLLRADEEEGEEGLVDDVLTLNGIPIGSRGALGNEDQGRRPKKSTLYPVHKAFLIRSPYFKTMFSGHFLEAQESEFLRIVKVDCVPEALEVILTYLYTEKSDCALDVALDVLYTADMLFLDTLKAKAVTTISTLGSGSNKIIIDNMHADVGTDDARELEVEPINVYDVIRAAWDLGIQRLEEFAGRYIAYRLEDYIDEDEFAGFVKESASRIKDRQETDTIELLDDIRHYLDERFRLRFEEAGLEELLDDEGSGPVNAAAPAAGVQADAGLLAIAPSPTAQGQGGVADEAINDSTSDHEKTPGEHSVSGRGAAMMTLDGEVVEDEFDRDAMNYRILLSKIDALLERLKLDA